MTKKEFLESRGYNFHKSLEEYNVKIYVKYFESCSLYIRFCGYHSSYYLEINHNRITDQEVIDDLQEALNTVKQDFEEMMKLEIKYYE